MTIIYVYACTYKKNPSLYSFFVQYNFLNVSCFNLNRRNPVFETKLDKKCRSYNLHP